METTRYKIIIQYDGTNFSGFQIQPNARTVQGEIERVLKIMAKGLEIKIQGSGRTDSGVHALGQVIHFDYPIRMPIENMKRALNSLTTNEIYVQQVEFVSFDFHARYQTTGKKYQYRVDTNPVTDPFKRLYTKHHQYPINLPVLEQALKDIEGTHDFSSFCASNSGREDKVRTVYEASVVEDPEKGELIFTFRGDGFLYNMVRIFIGTLLQIANGRRPADDMKRLLEVKDRRQAGPTAAPQGLYLVEVYYDVEEATKGTRFYQPTVQKSKGE
ncbi:tRNA pseudouridine(38-40) synthase TruA [Carnobacterium sp.]|uniref:tRNA pseudouridine(38-40) synthase TruA n=1 Tax=Carnobacterium sp. TaxID=48221 RepID=UPI0028B21697|nr:tRNA pseudouridine(38-40) synthase TruA [Carnobacterium sp.]